MNVVKFANDVLAMHDRIQDLEWENEQLRDYKQKYNDLLSESVTHGQETSVNMIKLLLIPGVADACAKNSLNV